MTTLLFVFEPCIAAWHAPESRDQNPQDPGAVTGSEKVSERRSSAARATDVRIEKLRKRVFSYTVSCATVRNRRDFSRQAERCSRNDVVRNHANDSRLQFGSLAPLSHCSGCHALNADKRPRETRRIGEPRIMRDPGDRTIRMQQLMPRPVQTPGEYGLLGRNAVASTAPLVERGAAHGHVTFQFGVVRRIRQA